MCKSKFIIKSKYLIVDETRLDEPRVDKMAAIILYSKTQFSICVSQSNIPMNAKGNALVLQP